jgi:hypothetical protein
VRICIANFDRGFGCHAFSEWEVAMGAGKTAILDRIGGGWPYNMNER